MSNYIRLMVDVLTRALFITDHDVRRQREVGADWPQDAETMVGIERLRNVATLCDNAISNFVPGDFMECGVWKGGCVIMMAAVLRDRNVNSSQRRVIVADSFQGCPVPSPDKYPADQGDKHHELKFLAVTPQEVMKNFMRYGLWTYANLLPGWFKDTLPGQVKKLAVLRLDGDLYESTIQCLEALYDKVSPGGYVIIDDYGAVAGCKQAVDDFRAKRGITGQVQDLVQIDWTGVYWQKENS